MVRVSLPPDHNDTDQMFKRTTYDPISPPEKVETGVLGTIVTVLVLLIIAVIYGFAKFVGLL